MTKTEFLEKAHNIHGYKYKYINLPNNLTTQSKITLNLNGLAYEQKVCKHLMGRCPEKNTPKKTTKQFIEEANLVWGDKYDYSLVKYDGALKKIKIKLNSVIYEQSAIGHLKGQAPETNIPNLEIFLKKSKEKWGDKYDYSLVEFTKSSEKVKIIYDNKIYEQTPDGHMIAAPERKSELKTTQQFIEECSKIHNNKYSYEKTIYTLAKNKVIITCPEHGDFEQCANSHCQGMGCILCGYEALKEIDRVKKTTDEFIQEAKLTWGDKYDYSQTEYKNARTKLKIIYDDIIYEQLPNSHLKYPVEGFLNQEIFLKRAYKKWGDKYDYSLVEFISTNHKVKIIYNDKTYEQYPKNHLTYAPERILKITHNEFIDKVTKIHGGKYSYEKTIYINDITKIIIICPDHGDFSQTPASHKKSGCPTCGESIGERKIGIFLKSLNTNFIREHKFPDCKNILELPFDFFVPSFNTCIEFDGIQHFEPMDYFGGEKAFKSQQLRDKIKTDYCENNYINLIRIRYDQIEKIPDILKPYIE
jgi:very-short-patch-repair endonuclease/signal peptidase I